MELLIKLLSIFRCDFDTDYLIIYSFLYLYFIKIIFSCEATEEFYKRLKCDKKKIYLHKDGYHKRKIVLIDCYLLH